ncbi:MAG: hypothetical protein LC722_02910 [Actinobacteria bacterium]|nr:hypothetical protein [Actinomycetota bacterium]
MGPHTRRRIAALAVAAAAMAPACGREAGPSPASSPSPDARLAGTIVTDEANGTSVVFRDLPDGDPISVRLPGSVDFAPAAGVADGAAIVMAYGRRTSVLRVEPGGQVRVLIGGLRDAISFSQAGERVMVGDCAQRAFLITGVDVGPVTRVERGCRGTLSPDGRLIAYIQDGAVWRVPVDGSAPPVRWFAIAAVPGLDQVVEPAGRGTGDLSWGAPGLAVAVSNESEAGVIVAAERGTPRVIDMLGPSFVSFLRWQPGGRLLGMANGQTGGEGFVRLYDPDTAKLKTIALHPRGFISAAWAPDGRSVVAVSGSGLVGAGNNGYLWFIDLDGRQYGKIRGPGSFVYGWLR